MFFQSNRNDVHGDDADCDQNSQDDGDLGKNSIPGAAFILAEVAVCIAAAGHGAQTLGLTLLYGNTDNDRYCQNENCRTENI